MFEPVDFAIYHQAGPAERVEFCTKLVDGLRKCGFVKLVNHDVPPSDIDKAFETASSEV